MGKPLFRQSGPYQWDARVAGTRDGMRQLLLITIFSNSRADAIGDACDEAIARGYAYPTVDHITRIGS